MLNQQQLNKIKTLLQQIKREQSNQKRQDMIVQVLELIVSIL